MKEKEHYQQRLRHWVPFTGNHARLRPGTYPIQSLTSSICIAFCISNGVHIFWVVYYCRHLLRPKDKNNIRAFVLSYGSYHNHLCVFLYSLERYNDKTVYTRARYVKIHWFKGIELQKDVFYSLRCRIIPSDPPCPVLRHPVKSHISKTLRRRELRKYVYIRFCR